jgi:pSer/pThr/pTyr-binding forkhead associated (FHA) protein
MVTRCPGCLTPLRINEDKFQDKVLIQCPECLYVFMVRPEAEGKEFKGPEGSEEEIQIPEAEASGDATLLASDFRPEGDISEFRWNVPGAAITVIDGLSHGIHVKLRKEKTVIGREKADIILKDPAISRSHAEIVKQGGEHMIRDLKSTNGTFVNGKRVDEKKLDHMDEIWVGKSRLLYTELGRMEEIREEDATGERAVVLKEEITRVTAEQESEMRLPEKREFFLEIMGGKKKARSFRFPSGRVIIGRSEEADFRLEDDEVSRKHALVEVFSREQIFLSDLASANGTFLNGIRIKTVRLKHSDLVRVGNTVLKFVIQDTP